MEHISLIMNQYGKEIIVAIIAASSALCGVILSQAISITLSFFDKRHKKQIMLREKYEEMMFHVQDSLLYYNQVGASKTLDQLLQHTHSIPANRAMGLALLYFPNLVPILDTYLRNLVQYYDVVVSSYRPNIPASAGSQAMVHNKEQTEEITRNLFMSKNKLIEELRKNIKSYTKA